jgi:endonuclease G
MIKKDLLLFSAIIILLLLLIVFTNSGSTVKHDSVSTHQINNISQPVENNISLPVENNYYKLDSSGVDTIIDAGEYKSYFDVERKQPIFVSYILYKGGGDCNRSNFRFKNDTEIKMATTKDYSGTGFDMGHLANAEDFANDCIAGEKTFRFYNCLPQYPNLNRGVWKRWENRARELSQKDSILIICGGKFGEKTIGEKVYVPEYCWKVIYSMKSGRVWKVLWFRNISKDSDKYFEEITLEKLEERLKYKLKMTY